MGLGLMGRLLANHLHVFTDIFLVFYRYLVAVDLAANVGMLALLVGVTSLETLLAGGLDLHFAGQACRSFADYFSQFAHRFCLFGSLNIFVAV